MTRLLLVDDDIELSDMLAEYLGAEGFEVRCAASGDAALAVLAEQVFDLVILDVMLPGRDGFEVLKALRRTQDVPVLMLTARGDDIDTVVGLELGADDYLSKPCSPRVLVARLKALLRRAQQPATAGRYELGDLMLDARARRVVLGEQDVELTGAEFNVLQCLVAEAGSVVDKEKICREALGRPLMPYDRSVDVHVSNLRRKLGPLPGGGTRIKTVRGAGYQYVVADA